MPTRRTTREPILTCPADAKPANLDFTMKDVDGAGRLAPDFKGKVILLDFWATWCGPCKVEIPHFIEFQEKYGPKGLQVVGVSVDDTVDKLEPVRQGHEDELSGAAGPRSRRRAGRVRPDLGIPVSVMISRDGKVCATHTGLTGKDVFETRDPGAAVTRASEPVAATDDLSH